MVELLHDGLAPPMVTRAQHSFADVGLGVRTPCRDIERSHRPQQAASIARRVFSLCRVVCCERGLLCRVSSRRSVVLEYLARCEDGSGSDADPFGRGRDCVCILLSVRIPSHGVLGLCLQHVENGTSHHHARVHPHYRGAPRQPASAPDHVGRRHQCGNAYGLPASAVPHRESCILGVGPGHAGCERDLHQRRPVLVRDRGGAASARQSLAARMDGEGGQPAEGRSGQGGGASVGRARAAESSAGRGLCDFEAASGCGLGDAVERRGAVHPQPDRIVVPPLQDQRLVNAIAAPRLAAHPCRLLHHPPLRARWRPLRHCLGAQVVCDDGPSPADGPQHQPTDGNVCDDVDHQPGYVVSHNVAC
mmetsp:Transcript_43949/g.88652  ORF Transcript_43949/g.88652 Transcript_43949/m.88652 type:complete len:362 (-) Transcript_43949:101-1186(-)